METESIVMPEDMRSKLAQMAAKSGNRGKLNFSRVPTPFCSVCDREKHTCKWGEARWVERKQASVPRGAVCYCCVRASLLLQVTRSVEAFKKVPGAMDIWRLRSKQEQAKLAAYDGDKCSCEACTS